MYVYFSHRSPKNRQEVRLLCFLALSGRELFAHGVFEQLQGLQSTPLRLLADHESLHAAYAALLTERPLRLRWRNRQVVGEERSKDAARRACLIYIYTSYISYIYI